METVCPGMRLWPPDLFQQHLACQYFATMRNEDFQQVVLSRRQLDILPIELHTTQSKINPERASVKIRFCSSLCNMAQCDTNASQHLIHAKGFCDVVIGSQIGCLHLVTLSSFY